MFKVQVIELAKRRGIKELHKYLMDHGVSKHHATELRQGRLERFDLELLMKLCIIFKCPINELIAFEPSDEKDLAQWPFLSEMLASEKHYDISSKLDKLDMTKLKLLEEFLERF